MSLGPAERADAVVIGSGPNGLVAGALLADAGWDVLVLEAEDEPGGAVRSGETVEPGFVHDRFSAFYPFGAISPVLRALDLEAHGLRWCRSDVALAHPDEDGRCALLHETVDGTAASLEAFGAGDGDGWRRMHALWKSVEQGFLESFFSPFPPIRGPVRIAATRPPLETLRFARFAMLPVRRMSEEFFSGVGGARLLGGNALHADAAPDALGSGLFGWLLTVIGQDVGYPVPEGGAGRLTAALVARLRAAGGRLECGQRVEKVVVEGGRATGVVTSSGTRVAATRAVLADTEVMQLLKGLVGEEHLPDRLRQDLDTFKLDTSTVKVDWALDGPIPWRAEAARRAGTVHVTEGLDALTMGSAQIACRQIPERPFCVLGQYAALDGTRHPEGKESAWAYTHVPQEVEGDAGGELTGDWAGGDADRLADRMEEEIERLAPGFRALVRRRVVVGPPGLEAQDANLVGGALNAGTAQLFQVGPFRPVAAHLGRAEVPGVGGLYLASASAHPAGGVHGAPGSNAARAALWAGRRHTAAAGAAAAGGAAAALGLLRRRR